jgi:hypothetical protein
LTTDETPIANTVTGPAALAAVVIFFQVAPIVAGFFGGASVPTFFCFTPPFSGVAFIVAAGVTLHRMWRRRNLSNGHRKLRMAMTVLLGLLVCDAATGGGYRWFEWSMSRQARQIQIDQFQAWAAERISSPERLAEWDNGGFDPQKIPAALLPGVRRDHIFYRPTGDGGPALQTNSGGLISCGFIVGTSAFTKAYPQGINGKSHTWTKQIRPGVFIYILDT